MPLVSVIIPVLNMELYLRRCLDSLLGQTFQDFEIIAIDNGSTDGSLAILGQAADRDPRLRVLQIPVRGVGAARNAGLAAAQGEWIGFADADDWVAPEFLARLVETAQQQQADIVVCDRTRAWPDGRQEEHQLGLAAAIPANPAAELLAWRYAGAVWNRLFRTSLLREHTVIFDTSLWSGEDLLFNLQAFLAANRVAVIPDSLYFYFQRPRSASSHGGASLFDNYTRVVAACGEELQRHHREADLNQPLARLYAKHFFTFAAGRLLNDPSLSARRQRRELRQMLATPELAGRLRTLQTRGLSWRELLWFLTLRTGLVIPVIYLCRRLQNAGQPVTILISTACGLGDFLMLESFIRAIDVQRPVILMLPERSLFKDELIRDWQLTQTRIRHYTENTRSDRCDKRWRLFKQGWRSGTVILPFANRLSDLALLAATPARKVYAVSPGPGIGRRLALGLLRLFSRQKQLVFKRHKTDQFLEMLPMGGLKSEIPEIPVPDLARRHFVLAPGYGSPGHQFKAWPRYHELIPALLARMPETEKIVLIGGGANDQAIIDAILEKLGPQPRVKAILNPDYARAKQILSHARTVIANDNGLAHWAGRLGSPVLVLSGPTSQVYTGQRGVRVRTLRRTIACSPCLHPDDGPPASLPPPRCRSIPCTDCMNFTTEEILTAIDQQIKQGS